VIAAQSHYYWILGKFMFCLPYHTLQALKSRRMRLVGRIACMEKRMNGFIGKVEGHLVDMGIDEWAIL